MDKQTTEKAVKEIRMDEKITVRSIAPWLTGFRRITTEGDVSIPPCGSVRLSREEVLAQGQSGNKLITGFDDKGSHANLYIEDEWTRQELEFDTKETKQTVLTKQIIKDAFAKKSFESFKQDIETYVVTRAEKFYLMDVIKSLKINSYDRIAFCEEYCGTKLNS